MHSKDSLFLSTKISATCMNRCIASFVKEHYKNASTFFCDTSAHKDCQCTLFVIQQDAPDRGTLLYNIQGTPYPEPVYTGWSSVHWNATGMPLVDPVYTGTPLEKLSWNSPTLECHWRNLVESAPHWNATGESLTFTAYTGTPLEGLWEPTHAPTFIV